MSWESIASALRDELAESGQLLGLFEQQQQQLFDRDAGAVLNTGYEIEAQARAVGESRVRRELAVGALAEAHGLPTTSTLRSLLHLVEPAARPLLEALIAEVNLLLHRIRRVSRQNHTLLARAIEMNQETLQHLRPQAFPRTYSPAGRVALAPAEPVATLKAAG
jgi:hypothetical protein